MPDTPANATTARVRSAACIVVLLLVSSAWAERAAPTVETRGREIYQLYCAHCHGPGGKGDGPLASGLAVRPRDFTDGPYMERSNDGTLAEHIRQGCEHSRGGTMMPNWASVLTDGDIGCVVTYIRAFPRR